MMKSPPPEVHSSELWAGSTRGMPDLRGNVGTCYVSVYVDGMLYYSKSDARDLTPPNMRAFDVNQFAGVEYYAGGASTPVQYDMTGSGCGVLLLWTRER